MKQKLRWIMVDGQIYLWRFSPGYLPAQVPDEAWRCHDLFTAYLSQARSSPLRVHFLTWEDPIVGGPLRSELPLDARDLLAGRTTGVNLHTPEQAARLIRRALAAGWQPAQSKRPFVIQQGVEWLLSNDNH
jgi:hypothetical protein